MVINRNVGWPNLNLSGALTKSGELGSALICTRFPGTGVLMGYDEVSVLSAVRKHSRGNVGEGISVFVLLPAATGFPLVQQRCPAYPFIIKKMQRVGKKSVPTLCFISLLSWRNFTSSEPCGFRHPRKEWCSLLSEVTPDACHRANK